MKTKLLLLAFAIFCAVSVPAQEKPDPPKVSIWSAANLGRLDTLQQHIDAGTDIDARDDKKGHTPLYGAVKRNRIEAVRMLIDAGADPNKAVTEDFFYSKTREKSTPLHYAVYRSRTTITAILMAAGADLSLEDSTGATPVDLLKESNISMMLPVLVPARLSAEAVEKEGARLMQLALGSSLENVIRKLIAAGADANGKYRDERPLLIAALAKRDYQVSVALLMGGADPDTKDAEGKTALELAMAKKELKPLLRYFLDAGVNLTPLLDTFPVNHALILTCLAGDEELVGSLLKKGADPEYVMPSPEMATYGLSNMGGWPSRVLNPMTAAIQSGSVDVLQHLLDAELDAQSVNGLSTIGLCLSYNQQQLIPLLLEAGADPESIHAGPWFQTTVVHAAAGAGQVEALEYLVAAGADVNLAVNPQNNQPELNQLPLHLAIQAGELETTRFLLENGADKHAKLGIRASRGPGVTKVDPIILAVMSDNIEIVDLFIEHGVPLEGVQLPNHLQPRFSREFLEPLLERGAVVAEAQLIHLVYQWGSKVKLDNAEDLIWYLDNGFLIDGSNQQLETILHAAVKLALPLSSFEILVEAGADVNAINLQGKSPLDAALVRAEDEWWLDGDDVVAYLEEAGAEESNLPSYLKAIEADDVEVLTFYLEQGLHPNYQTTQGGGPAPIFSSEPLLVAALKNDAMGCAQLLVDKGADVNVRIRQWRDSSTPILLMVQAGNVSGVEFLLENGADVGPSGPSSRVVGSLNLNNQNIASENVEILQLLIEAGANVNATAFGKSLLSRLAYNGRGHGDVALLLLENGADGYGSRQLFLAAIQGHLELLEWLLDHGVDPLGADHYLNTALHHAAIHDHPEVARRLVSAETMAALNAFGETPLDVAEGETYDLLDDHDAPDGHGVSFWSAIREGNLELVKDYLKNGMNLRVAEPRSEGNDRNLSPVLQAVESKQSDIVLYLIERHENIFAETNLMGEVKRKRLREVEKKLESTFRLAYRLHEGSIIFFYAGFDDSALYHLESSTDLKKWTKILGTERSFRNRPENTYHLEFPQFIETQQFIRLRKKED